ncbi:hypothetical protein ACJRO7_005591 [Eucalyptus globulus]|uniref:Uncharacterized protein n=1 Tax=Eucalyptus globulus TaxID=34317 RepID=A0ABD3J846_EUCGL
MVRSPCCAKVGINKGAWSSQEDEILINYVKIHGEGKWRKVAQNAGLNRCAKSCRLRWLNYLRPGIKRGDITKDEEDLIIRLHGLLGNRWALIAGRLPGRTDNEIKNYWNTNLAKNFGSFSSRSSCKMKFDQDLGIQEYQDHITMNHSPVDPNEPLGISGIPILKEEEKPLLANESTSFIKNGSNDHGQDMFSSLLVGDDDDLSFLMSIDTDFGEGVTDFDLQLFRDDQAAVRQENDDLGIIVSRVDSNDGISSSSLHSSGHDQVKVERGLMSGQIPSLHLELKKLASFLDLEDDWTEL